MKTLLIALAIGVGISLTGCAIEPMPYYAQSGPVYIAPVVPTVVIGGGWGWGGRGGWRR